ncbi:MAG TPA: DUF5666 domain-containing protein [Candidatus Angelobacter sp.]|jgi:hypothetical protein|nr:DUF5666 domain-containing protein [Candidatus Angelobacter sp.]
MAIQQKNKRFSTRYAVILAIGILALSAVAWGHGNQKHVMGTVRAVDQSSITVETASHEKQTVQVTAETKIFKGGQPASLKELQVGERVVIHAKNSGSTLEATEVRFGATPAAASH